MELDLVRIAEIEAETQRRCLMARMVRKPKESTIAMLRRYIAIIMARERPILIMNRRLLLEEKRHREFNNYIDQWFEREYYRTR